MVVCVLGEGMRGEDEEEGKLRKIRWEMKIKRSSRRELQAETQRARRSPEGVHFEKYRENLSAEEVPK